MNKPNAIIRSITFEVTQPNADGEVTLIAVARVGDGSDAVNMGNEYQCVPEMLSHVQQLAANQVMDLAFDYLTNDARCVVCETCGRRTTKAWSTEVEPEWHCDTCDSVQPQTTQPLITTIYKGIINPRLANRPILVPGQYIPLPGHSVDTSEKEALGLGFPVNL